MSISGYVQRFLTLKPSMPYFSTEYISMLFLVYFTLRYLSLTVFPETNNITCLSLTIILPRRLGIPNRNKIPTHDVATERKQTPCHWTSMYIVSIDAGDLSLYWTLFTEAWSPIRDIKMNYCCIDS